jgi:hypothetical protein
MACASKSKYHRVSLLASFAEKSMLFNFTVLESISKVIEEIDMAAAVDAVDPMISTIGASGTGPMFGREVVVVELSTLATLIEILRCVCLNLYGS